MMKAAHPEQYRLLRSDTDKHLDAAFIGMVGRPSAMEQSMLDFADNVKENSRLSCRIKIRDDLDGLKVTTPESQQ